MENKNLLVKQYSNPEQVYKNSLKYFKKHIPIYFSTRKNKKYMVFDEKKMVWVHFGSMNPPMEDFTKHQDKERRKRYLLRALNIKGNWKLNPYSPNNLSINLLWM